MMDSEPQPTVPTTVVAEIIGDGTDPDADFKNKNRLIARLVNEGVEPEVISAAFNLDLARVRSVAVTTRRMSHNLPQQEVDIASRTKDLIERALIEAAKILSYGTEESKLQILKPLIMGAVRMTVSATEADTTVTVKEEWNSLMVEMRSGGPAE